MFCFLIKGSLYKVRHIENKVKLFLCRLELVLICTPAFLIGCANCENVNGRRNRSTETVINVNNLCQRQTACWWHDISPTGDDGPLHGSAHQRRPRPGLLQLSQFGGHPSARLARLRTDLGRPKDLSPSTRHLPLHVRAETGGSQQQLHVPTGGVHRQGHQHQHLLCCHRSGRRPCCPKQAAVGSTTRLQGKSVSLIIEFLQLSCFERDA